MNITRQTRDILYKACVKQVKDQIKNIDINDTKHAFHESANFVILEPQSLGNSVVYNGKVFSHTEQNKIFNQETIHYNKLISSTAIESLIHCLNSDKESKKAYLSFWKNEFVFGKSGEIPCLTGIQFYIEENNVFAVVQMRSNELLTLLPIDICFGIALQTYIATQLQKEIGSYTHQVASLILYSRDIDKLKAI